MSAVVLITVLNLCIAPLKLLGQELGLSVNHIPEDKADFKLWQVHPSLLGLACEFS